MDATKKDFLEREYTPSLFSKRFSDRDELFKHYLEFSARESEASRFNYNCILNVAYGKTFREKLDIYGVELAVSSPLFVFVHGGYWQMCDKWGSAFVVKPFVESGIKVAVVDYELCPEVTLEQLITQVKESFKWISDYVKQNSIKSVAIAGHSAGAHLLACALTKDFIGSLAADVKLSTFFISGIYDLQELRHLDAANENNILSLSEANVKQVSPQFFDFSHLQHRDIKHYVFAGENESDKFKEQSKDFAEITLKNLSLVTSKIMPGLDHFDIVEKLSEADYELTKIIVKNCLQR